MRCPRPAESPSSPLRGGALLVLAALLGLTATTGTAQDKPPPDTVTPAASESPPIQAIPASQITARAEETTRSLRSIRERMAPTGVIQTIEAEREAFAQQLDEMQQSPVLAELPRLGLRALDEQRIAWSSAERKVQDWQKILTVRSTALDALLTETRILREPWDLTLNTKDKDEPLPAALVERVNTTLKDIAAVREQLRQRLDAVLTLQNQISERLVLIDDVLTRIGEARSAFRDQMLVRIDGQPLWELFVEKPEGEEEDLQMLLGDSWRESLKSAARYVDDHPDRLVAVILCFLILAGLLLVIRARRRARHSGQDTEDVLDVLSRPVASALLVSIVVGIWLSENPPLALLDLMRMAAAVPFLLLVRRVVPREMRLAVYALILLYVLDMGGNLFARRPETERLLNLLIAGAALSVIVWVLWPGGWASSSRGGNYWRVTLRLLQASTLALTVAIVANVAGALTLSGVLTDATLTSAYIGFGLYVFVLILQGLMDAFLSSRIATRSRGIGRHPQGIKTVFENLTNLLAVVAWAATSLRAFRLLDPVWDGLKTLFLASVQFGNFEISLSDIFGFVVALWLGVMISRTLRFVLEEDVYPRVSLPRGVPSAISKMIHYAIITIAFFVALAVAGIELGKFAIIAGAVGVGIGFGLQNIVNNFVSGLILLFERPIQSGDCIDLGVLSGRVVRIGIRSSTVRTYQGAEVIVPNADLIAKEVINWTLSDANRRLEVPVGVSYKSDPREVIKILLAAARANREVMSEPEAFAIWIGYGASSIDFELRCWVQNFGEGLRIKTDLLLDIWDRLEAAGIEIPFPQRDLNLRSVDGKAAATLAGRPAPTPRETPPPAPEEMPDDAAGDETAPAAKDYSDPAAGPAAGGRS